MAIDFQQVQSQVKQMGETAVQRSGELKGRRESALGMLSKHAEDPERLVERVERIRREADPNLRCGVPAMKLERRPEPLNYRSPLPELPPSASLLAADGSQINPDRHAQANFCMINVGAIQMRLGLADAPQVTIESRLVFDEEMFTPRGVISEAQVALRRDLSERKRLSELASQAQPPVITLTDGPMELWGGGDSQDRDDFAKSLDAYQEALRSLCEIGATTAGYVDKPSANLVVRLLETAMLPEGGLREIKNFYPLRGVSDRWIYQRLLAPGERSAVFAIQSRSAAQYSGDLGLHFFYLNVGLPGNPWLARVETPLWVARDQKRLDDLQAVLFQQCQILGSRPYPYLIHRAHEAAVVSFEEKEQISEMIVRELLSRGVELDSFSAKQSIKNLDKRTRL